MSSKTSEHSSNSIVTKKPLPLVSNSSTLGTDTTIQRTTSDDDFDYKIHAPLARESSSGFNYQTLAEASPSNETKAKYRLPIRSHSSTNVELSHHLQQLKSLSKRGNNRNNNEERRHLTSLNLETAYNENGKETSIHSTVEVRTMDANSQLPISWKPAIQQTTIQRDIWTHKIEFLLAVIGYAVDLGDIQISKHMRSS